MTTELLSMWNLEEGWSCVIMIQVLIGDVYDDRPIFSCTCAS